jgi:hypothetical protein
MRIQGGSSMEEQRFAPPLAVVADIDSGPDVPDGTLKKIRQAWIACLVSAAITLVFSLLAMGSGGFAGFGASNLFDVALILAFAYGISRRSRVCAVLMFAYFLLSKYLMFKATGQFGGGILAIVFMWFYGQGVAGTFEYHKLVRR